MIKTLQNYLQKVVKSLLSTKTPPPPPEDNIEEDDPSIGLLRNMQMSVWAAPGYEDVSFEVLDIDEDLTVYFKPVDGEAIESMEIDMFLKHLVPSLAEVEA